MNNELMAKIITALIICFGMLIFYGLVAKIIKRVFKIKTKKVNTKKQKTLMNFFLNVTRVLAILIALIMILELFGIKTSAIITSLGAVTVVIGLAFQDLLKDLIAGITLVFEDSYNVGDTITINNFKGEVISMGLRQTRIKAYTGEILIINNGSITEIINHTTANAMAIVDIDVAYKSDIEQVEKVLNKLCEKLNKNLPTLKGEVQVLGVEALAESSVKFRVVAEVEAGSQFSVQREIRKAVKLEFDKHNIEIPYNQLVVHNE